MFTCTDGSSRRTTASARKDACGVTVVSVEEFREGMKRGIVAFSIAVERVDAKFKLSQNRPVEDRARVLQAMDEGGERARVLANWTRRVGEGDA